MSEGRLLVSSFPDFYLVNFTVVEALFQCFGHIFLILVLFFWPVNYGFEALVEIFMMGGNWSFSNGRIV